MSPTHAPSPAKSAPAFPGSEWQSATFMAVVDGDTVQTDKGSVRLMGIDAPELGECGYDDASRTIGDLLSAGDSVQLVLSAGQNDRDSYGRLIRYVITSDGIDLGLMQLEAGQAVARYDSTDGYPEHPQQATYHTAQLASLGPDRSVVTLDCQAIADRTTQPSSQDDDAVDRWWLQYPSCAQLKKNTAGHPTGPFNRDNPDEAAIYEWFAYGTGNRGDGDGDGLACE